MQEGTPRPTPPAPEAIARCLLAGEEAEAQDTETLLAAAEQAFVQMRVALGLFLGTNGFDSLWTRATQLAQRARRSQQTKAKSDPSSSSDRWAAARHAGDVTEVYAVLVTQFASFIALLYTFLGEELGWRLIRPALPKGSLPDDNLPTEDG